MANLRLLQEAAQMGPAGSQQIQEHLITLLQVVKNWEHQGLSINPPTPKDHLTIPHQN